ncbi:MAG TPA: glutathione S-transferase family protein [Acidimicrobiia bacterium]|jgi:glutathione S-transferase|nr:glutathione S-transferase family protein [Acidimicrobiia bacterium]
MTLTFYTSPMSTATITDVCMAELDIPHERVVVDIKGGGSKKPEFLAINPNGKVPAIVHDGVAIWESAAITIYLGETFGTAKKLWPEPGPKRGEAMKWVVWSNVTLGDAVYRIGRNTGTWVPADQQNAKVAEVAAKEVHELLGMLDTSLATKQFICGSDFTLADAHINSFLDWLRYQKMDFSAFKNLNAWGERCAARPGYKKANAH